jgi:hypothetical protein
MAVLKEIVVANGKYTDKDGKEKNSYITVGRVIETKNGNMIKFDSVPVGWDGWAYMNDPKPRDTSSTGEPSKAQATHSEQKSNGYQKSPASIEDDLPF